MSGAVLGQFLGTKRFLSIGICPTELSEHRAALRWTPSPTARDGRRQHQTILLGRRKSPVHGQDLAGHERPGLRTEEHDRADEVVDLGDPTQRIRLMRLARKVSSVSRSSTCARPHEGGRDGI